MGGYVLNWRALSSNEYPVLLTFDNNYFNSLYQGIPVDGYTAIVENMLDGIEVQLNCDYLSNKEDLTSWLNV